jgi:hypothetical protein
MTPQAAWEFTKQLSPLPGPGGAPSELEQAAQGKYADMGLPEIYPVAQIKENQQISVKVEAAKAKMAAEQQAQEQGLPHPPQAPILEQLLAQERQRKGEPPMPQGQMPPQGMPQQGMPQQGMPPQGMPPQGPQGMPQQGIPGQAYGGLVGLQAGGELFNQAQSSADVVDPEEIGDPWYTRAWEHARENPFSTMAQIGLTAASINPAVRGLRWAGTGLRGLLGTKALGRGMASWAQKGPIRSKIARALTGRDFHPTAGYIDPKTKQFLGQAEIGRRALLRGGTGAAVAGTATGYNPLTSGLMPWNWGGDDEEAAEEESYEEFMARMFPDADGATTRDKGDGIEGIGSGDRAKFNEMRTQLEEHEKWLRDETPEEEAARLFRKSRATDMRGRIDPERNSRERQGMLFDILTTGLTAAPDSAGPGSGVRAMQQYGGGVGGIRSLTALGREQEAYDHALEDMAAEYEGQILDTDVERARRTTLPERLEISGAEMDYDLAMRQINAGIEAASMQLQAARILSPADLKVLHDMTFQMVMSLPGYSEMDEAEQNRLILAHMDKLLSGYNTVE